MIVMKSSVFPAARETVFEIYIVRFDPEGVSSREGNEQVPVWNHDITMVPFPYGKPVQSWLKDRYGETEANQIWELTKEIVDVFIDRILIYDPEHMEIHWKLPDEVIKFIEG